MESIADNNECPDGCNYCKAPYDSEECDCVYCCVCGEVNMTELTDNMEDTCVECKKEEEDSDEFE
tara:strand:+ start:960 stop:1154 length:195 start_codon:yes stop_codon:yes gene_type:complete